MHIVYNTDFKTIRYIKSIGLLYKYLTKRSKTYEKSKNFKNCGDVYVCCYDVER